MLEFIRLERHEDALQALQQLLDRHPDYLGTFYSAAKYLEQQQQPARATALYRQGLDLARRLGDHKTAAELQAALEQLDA
jgi:tetratricopeptide (TPR) repeat protein